MEGESGLKIGDGVKNFESLLALAGARYLVVIHMALFTPRFNIMNQVNPLRGNRERVQMMKILKTAYADVALEAVSSPDEFSDSDIYYYLARMIIARIFATNQHRELILDAMIQVVDEAFTYLMPEGRVLPAETLEIFYLGAYQDVLKDLEVVTNLQS